MSSDLNGLNSFKRLGQRRSDLKRRVLDALPLYRSGFRVFLQVEILKKGCTP